jgi:DNA ligase 4
MYFTRESDREMIANNIDEYGDSYYRDLTVDSLRRLCDTMETPSNPIDQDLFFNQLEEHGINVEDLPGNIFRRMVAFFDNDGSDVEMRFAEQIIRFANGKIANGLEDTGITHVVIGRDRSRLDEIKSTVSRRRPTPRIVTTEWVIESWSNKTVLDAESKFIVLNISAYL